MNTTREVVQGELYSLFTDVANAALIFFAPEEVTDSRISLLKFLQQHADSKNALLKELSASLKAGNEAIPDMLESLHGLQLEQSIGLIDEYKKGIKRLEKSEQRESDAIESYLLELSYNIQHDIRNYLDEYNEMVRRKAKPLHFRQLHP